MSTDRAKWSISPCHSLLRGLLQARSIRTKSSGTHWKTLTWRTFMVWIQIPEFSGISNYTSKIDQDESKSFSASQLHLLSKNYHLSLEHALNILSGSQQRNKWASQKHRIIESQTVQIVRDNKRPLKTKFLLEAESAVQPTFIQSGSVDLPEWILSRLKKVFLISIYARSHSQHASVRRAYLWLQRPLLDPPWSLLLSRLNKLF